MNTKIVTKLREKTDLSQEEAGEMLNLLLSETVSDDDKKDMLIFLSEKGESISEIVGFVSGMRERMIRIPFNNYAIDTCGTGGDGKGTFNISTASAFVVAGCNIPVAKHGNRSATSRCGSADVLEALGVNISMNVENAQQCLEEIGITFLFAPLYHPAMKVLGPIRKSLGRPSIFNILGPFLNPVGVKKQMIGVSSIEKAEKLIGVGKILDYDYLILVSSEDGLDEVSTDGLTHVFEYSRGKVKRSVIDPKKFGLYHSLSSIAGGDVEMNAEILKRVLKGEQSAYRDAVLLNSAVALLTTGFAFSVTEGITKAQESIDTGHAQKKLDGLIKISNNL